MKIIGEVGCNFKDIKDAKLYIQKLREISVDLVKFQLFSLEYAKQNDIPEYLSLTFDQAKELFDYGKSIQQEVFFTPFHINRIDWCEKIGVNYYKIRFADRFNLDLIDSVINTNKDWFISIGLWADVPVGVSNRDILYCVPHYPATIWKYLDNLSNAESISDHTPDLRLMKIAKIIGVNWFEKHVKLRQDCLESEWSVFIHELGEVINETSLL